jgi:hypothetical protein
MYPHLNVDGVTGGVHLPLDGQCDPANIAMALAKGARMRGARIFEGVKVTGGRRRRAASPASPPGERAATSPPTWWSTAPACGAARWAPWRASTCRCRPASTSTSSPSRSRGLPRDLPVLRVPDECAYYKEDAGKILLGAFEPVAKPWGMDGIPEDFCFDQLPEDFDHFEPILEAAVNRMPMLETAGIHTFFNGPESFTPDDRYLPGRGAGARGYWSPPASTRSASSRRAAPAWRWRSGWTTGEPPFDLWDVDIRRMQPFQNNRRYLGARDRDAGPALRRPLPLPPGRDRARRAPLAAARAPEGARRLSSARSPAGSAPTGSPAEGQEREYRYSWGRQNWFDNAAPSTWRCARASACST